MLQELEMVWDKVPTLAQWFVGGVAMTLIGIIIERIFFREKSTYSIKQSQKSDNHSQSIQIGAIIKSKNDE